MVAPQLQEAPAPEDANDEDRADLYDEKYRKSSSTVILSGEIACATCSHGPVSRSNGNVDDISPDDVGGHISEDNDSRCGSGSDGGTRSTEPAPLPDQSQQDGVAADQPCGGKPAFVKVTEPQHDELKLLTLDITSIIAGSPNLDMMGRVKKGVLRKEPRTPSDLAEELVSRLELVEMTQIDVKDDSTDGKEVKGQKKEGGGSDLEAGDESDSEKEEFYSVKEEPNSVKKESDSVKEESDSVKKESGSPKEESDSVKKEFDSVNEDSDLATEESDWAREESDGEEYWELEEQGRAREQARRTWWLDFAARVVIVATAYGVCAWNAADESTGVRPESERAESPPRDRASWAAEFEELVHGSSV